MKLSKIYQKSMAAVFFGIGLSVMAVPSSASLYQCISDNTERSDSTGCSDFYVDCNIGGTTGNPGYMGDCYYHVWNSGLYCGQIKTGTTCVDSPGIPQKRVSVMGGASKCVQVATQGDPLAGQCICSVTQRGPAHPSAETRLVGDCQAPAPA